MDQIFVQIKLEGSVRARIISLKLGDGRDFIVSKVRERCRKPPGHVDATTFVST